MLREAIETGDTVELAFEAACRTLGVQSHEAEFEILEMPVRKTLGLFGGSPAKVRAYIKISPAQVAADYLKTVLEQMGMSALEISIEEVEGGAVLNLEGEGTGFIIGRRGETLDALQYLSGLVANHVDNSYYRVTINTGNYREKREKTLEILGHKMAMKAVKTGRNWSLEPMNPYERRIIHSAVQTVNGAKSWSEGEDLNRHVVIGPVEGAAPARTGGQGFRRDSNQRYPRSNGPRPYNNNRPNNTPRPDNRNFSRPAGDSRPAATNRPAAESRPQQAETPAAPLYGKINTNK